MSRPDYVVRYMVREGDAGVSPVTAEAVDVPADMLARVELVHPVDPEVLDALRRILMDAELAADPRSA